MLTPLPLLKSSHFLPLFIAPLLFPSDCSCWCSHLTSTQIKLSLQPPFHLLICVVLFLKHLKFLQSFKLEYLLSSLHFGVSTIDCSMPWPLTVIAYACCHSLWSSWYFQMCFFLSTSMGMPYSKSWGDKGMYEGHAVGCNMVGYCLTTARYCSTIPTVVKRSLKLLWFFGGPYCVTTSHFAVGFLPHDLWIFWLASIGSQIQIGISLYLPDLAWALLISSAWL